MRTVVHLSDLHFGRVDPRIVPSLVHVISTIAPNLVAVSGDLTQRARRSQFVQARAFLQQLSFPQIVVPGNHDVPLFNVAARLVSPLAGYRRYIARDLEPVFQDEEIIVVALNSARRAILPGGAGRLNEGQVERAAARLKSAVPGVVKVVVTHHPFELPKGHGEKHLIGRSQMAMAQLAAVGADLFLAGHLHVSHVGHTAERYQIAGHSALVVQAGTMSTRGRGEPNSFNVVRLARPDITVERLTWDEGRQTFLPSWSEQFQHGPEGWAALPPKVKLPAIPQLSS
jgi:3',5'-cyclic AMP phosphodiesterase CpdA